MKLVLLLLFAALPAHAQFDLVLADGTPAPPLYDLGKTYSGESTAGVFHLRNTTAVAQTLSSLGVAGAGFTLAGPSVPVAIPAQSAIDLTVTFRATDTGSYSAALHADGVSILLTATVVPSLTYRVDGAPLSTLDFGNVMRGSTAQRVIAVRNDTAGVLIIPAISAQGGAFSLIAPLPSGQALQPAQSGQFAVLFSPSSNGPFQGTLAIGDRSYPLAGAGVDPPLPLPSLAINLQPAASAQQGTLLVRFDAPAQTAGAGSATLDFRGASDPAIAFAAGGRSASFAVAPGDTQATLGFQTGTTAGTLTFTVRLGAATVLQSVDIAAAQPTIAASLAIRSAASIEIRVTGYDNARTLGPLGFTFSDAAGKTLNTIHTDATADFAAFFATSDLGGVFLLRAVFPITGDASQIAACDVTLTNSKGATTQHIAF